MICLLCQKREFAQKWRGILPQLLAHSSRQSFGYAKIFTASLHFESSTTKPAFWKWNEWYFLSICLVRKKQFDWHRFDFKKYVVLKRHFSDQGFFRSRKINLLTFVLLLTAFLNKHEKSLQLTQLVKKLASFPSLLYLGINCTENEP